MIQAGFQLSCSFNKETGKALFNGAALTGDIFQVLKQSHFQEIVTSLAVTRFCCNPLPLHGSEQLRWGPRPSSSSRLRPVSLKTIKQPWRQHSTHTALSAGSLLHSHLNGAQQANTLTSFLWPATMPAIAWELSEARNFSKVRNLIKSFCTFSGS